MSDNGKRLKVGVVGAGIAHSADGRENFAVRAHLPALKALKDLFEVAAVCTTRMESAGEAAKRFDVPNAFDNVEEMLSKVPELDIVCVSVRPGLPLRSRHDGPARRASTSTANTPVEPAPSRPGTCGNWPKRTACAP